MDEQAEYGYAETKADRAAGEVELLDKETARLSDQISRLTDRLRPILEPERPVAEVGEKLAGGSPLSEVRQELSAQVDRLVALSERVSA